MVGFKATFDEFFFIICKFLPIIRKPFIYLRLDFILACERILISILDLEDLNCTEDLRLVGQITDPCRVWHDGFVAAIAFVKSRELIDNSATKYDLVRSFFVIVAEVLAALVNRLLPELIDDLLNRVEKEALEGENLLGH